MEQTEKDGVCREFFSCPFPFIPFHSVFSVLSPTGFFPGRFRRNGIELSLGAQASSPARLLLQAD
jgi:hypothetical protein